MYLSVSLLHMRKKVFWFTSQTQDLLLLVDGLGVLLNITLLQKVCW